MNGKRDLEAILVRINGRDAEGREGMTVLDLALESGVRVPTLCHSPYLKPSGYCRLCLFEDERTGLLRPACATPLKKGMVINTESPRVAAARKAVIRLLLASHGKSCGDCDTESVCELRKIALEYGIEEAGVERPECSFSYEDTNPLVGIDPSKCVRCGKCVRACEHRNGAGNGEEGAEPGGKIPPLTLPLNSPACGFSGSCAAVCPTGAIFPRHEKPGSGKTERVRTVCSFCGCGCEMNLLVEGGKIRGAEAGIPGSVNGIYLCARGRFGYDYAHSPDRLTTPLVKRGGRFEAASWEEVIPLVAGRLREIRDKHGPDSIGVFGSIRCTNEENFLLQKLARAALGTNNTSSSARMIAYPTIMALTRAFGYGCSTNSLETVGNSDVILLLGSNPHDSHPLVAHQISRAVRERGAKLILVDPRRAELTHLAALILNPVPGTDLALINGLVNVILDQNLHDRNFVLERTEGFDKLQDCVDRYPPRYVEKITGVSEKKIVSAALAVAGAQRLSILYGTGITQYINAMYSIIALANLAMVTGGPGNPGSGIFPLSRENNCQGACDMGAMPEFLPGYRKINDAEARAELENEWGAAPPAAEGMNGSEMITAALSGGMKGLVLAGANPVDTFPDAAAIRRALGKLEFMVAVDIFPTATAELAHVVLPGACFAEKDGTYTSLDRRIQRIRKAVEPPGAARPEWRILSDLIRALGRPADYSHPSEIMDEIARVTPIYRGVNYGRLDRGPLRWPCMTREDPGTDALYEEYFPYVRGRLSKVEYLVPDEEPNIEYPFRLLTRSDRFHFGSGARTSRSANLARVSSRFGIEISPADAERLGILDGAEIEVTSRVGSMRAAARIRDGVPPGMLFAPVSAAGEKVFTLFSSDLDMLTRVPNKKLCVVRIEVAVHSLPGC